ncbi:hypothetical protein SAMN04487948_112121 [Halogranum amylolyticum]|uniref:RNA ligase domain-containing protein n=1 Tax=Halogranum amylolyticum TaxID=660520 RepID=A0A1H8UU19_9EURY|nr:hypothetical protein [Halogranum amylolyticum]SEP06685.1 hypothetical protein SAMN04487948_112121 [Halogranum amylolyticum]
MHQFRDLPPVSTGVDGLLDGGHLWLQELLVGGPFRFQLQSSGRLRVGDDEAEYDPEDAPPQYRHTVRHVRESCDWSALRSAVDDVQSVVFFGRAIHNRGLDYDWERTPSFLGTDVWVGEKDAFLGVDTVEHVFERLGLDPVNTFAKELRAVDFDPSSYEFPQSAWYDGPAAGVVVRNKRGACGTLENPAVDVAEDPSVDPTTAEELAAEVVTPSRVQRVVATLERQGRPATFDAVYDRLLESVFRELHPSRFADLDRRVFRSTVAERTRRLR